MSGRPVVSRRASSPLSKKNSRFSGKRLDQPVSTVLEYPEADGRHRAVPADTGIGSLSFSQGVALMFSSRSSVPAVGLCLLAVFAPSVLGQPTTQTRTVDPESGRADHQTIAGALSFIGNSPTAKWTVLIYAGTYTEEVVLDDSKENIDLVGADRDAVIIQAPANKDAITIKGVGARNNSIRNLTILTNDSTADEGRGIVIKKEGTGDNLSNITIDGVAIKTQAHGSNGIDVQYLEDGLTIRNCRVETISTGSHALLLRASSGMDEIRNLQVFNSQFLARGGSSGGINNDSDAIRVDHPLLYGVIQDAYLQTDGLGLAINLESGADGTQYLGLEHITVRNFGAFPMLDLRGSTRTRLANSDLLDADSPYTCVYVGTDTHIQNTSIVVDRAAVDPPIAQYDSSAVYGSGASGLRIFNSCLQALQWGLRLDNNCTDVVVSNSEMISSHYGVFLECGDNIRFENCTIIGDSANGKLATSPPEYHGVFIDDKDSTPTCEPGSISFTGCTIRAASHEENLDARGVYVKASPASSDGPVVFKDCNISARVTVTDAQDADQARAFGVVADEADAVNLDGGSIASFDRDERESVQFDVYNNSGGGPAVKTSGVKFSRWKGPVSATLQPASMTQRLINVAAVSNTAILAATALTASEQTITTGITQPDAYRVLSVKGNQGGMTQNVILIGTNFANERITDVIALNGTTLASGVKPFKTVSKIILPAQSAPGQTVSIGNTAKLGLYFAVGAGADVLQQARKASAATSYTLEPIGSVDAMYATVDVGVTTPITAGDSFEIAYLASR
ncbi:MAG: hypothetical protein KJ057_06210 [Phycisphaerae bacterium]|nr:hypothetical protein [Phycisphaerae bacterium]